MRMRIDFDFLREPRLQFGEYFEHEDSKTGLAEFGPFGRNEPGLHRSEIKLGFLGTGDSIAGAKEWIADCGSPIESQNIKEIRSKIDETEKLFAVEQDEQTVVRVLKILNRDFVGFSRESQWGCEFQLNKRWERELRPQDIDHILKIEDKQARINELVAFFADEIKSMAKTAPAPDIIVVALTAEIEERAEAVQVSGNFYLNFRRALKAAVMKHGKPIQIVRRSTMMEKRAQLQEKATRAWNFCTAMYYKADCVPWRLVGLSPDTCFVGIDFFVSPTTDEKLSVRSSVAQAFDHLGQGVVLRSEEPFVWDEQKLGRSPHMPTRVAHGLIERTLNEYFRVRESLPRRVVVHKSSRFWGDEHPEYNEMDGLYSGIAAVAPKALTDFVTMSQSGVRLFRQGQYPPARGTFFTLGGERHYVYTMGYVPYLETYPGSYVPEPWEIVEHHGGSSPKELMREVLALTKMNVNNCSYADGRPITLSFAKKVGEVMKHIPAGESVEAGYKYYM
jgi:hypothetical protein